MASMCCILLWEGTGCRCLLRIPGSCLQLGSSLECSHRSFFRWQRLSWVLVPGTPLLWLPSAEGCHDVTNTQSSRGHTDLRGRTGWASCSGCTFEESRMDKHESTQCCLHCSGDAGFPTVSPAGSLSCQRARVIKSGHWPKGELWQHWHCSRHRFLSLKGRVKR